MNRVLAINFIWVKENLPFWPNYYCNDTSWYEALRCKIWRYAVWKCMNYSCTVWTAVVLICTTHRGKIDREHAGHMFIVFREEPVRFIFLKSDSLRLQRPTCITHAVTPSWQKSGILADFGALFFPLSSLCSSWSVSKFPCLTLCLFNQCYWEN